MREHQVPEAYIHLIAALYGNQKGNVDNSTQFDINRGVKQGDVRSALLFNCALDVAFSRWRYRLNDHGISMENGRRITNIRYADEILLYGKSLQEVSFMLEILTEGLRHIGLSLSAKKFKILTTAHQHCDNFFYNAQIYRKVEIKFAKLHHATHAQSDESKNSTWATAHNTD